MGVKIARVRSSKRFLSGTSYIKNEQTVSKSARDNSSTFLHSPFSSLINDPASKYGWVSVESKEESYIESSFVESSSEQKFQNLSSM